MAKGTRTTGATASGRRSGAGAKAAKGGAKAAAAVKRVVKPAAKNTAKKKASPPVTRAAKATKSVKKAAPKKAVPAKATKTAKAAAKKAAPKAPVKAAAKKAAPKAPPKAPAKKAATKAPVKAPAKTAAKTPAKKAAKVLKPALAPKPAPSRPVLSEVVARKHRTPAVAASTMERLRALLLEEMGHHARQAEGLLAEAEALANEREPGDTQFDEESGEGDTLSVERERDLALSTAARQTVDEIEKALARMDDGTYGYCEICGDRIPVPRLEAIPWADQCVKCKSRGERRR